MNRASPTMRDRARSLRKALTVSERKLWNWLRNRTFCGFKFRRQFPVGPFVLDFYCPELNLAIEVDGAHHAQVAMAAHDDRRTVILVRNGIGVVRIENELLAKDPRLAAERIRFAIAQRAEEVAR